MNKFKFDAQYIFEDGFGYFLAIIQLIIKKGKNDIENENIHYNKKDRTKNNYHDRINDD